jgi:hypothetical protein
MDCTPRSFWRRVVTWVFVPLAAAAALAEENPRPLEGGEKVSLTFSLLATPREAATRPMASMGPLDLGVGEGMIGRGSTLPFAFGAGACSGGLSIEPVEATLARYPVAWTADVTVTEASTDRLVLSGSWERFTRGTDGKPVRAAGASISRLSLREGERVLLDLVAPPSSGDPACMRNFALELTAQIKEDPALAERRIAYDVWLVHDTPDGKHSSQRSRMTARHGEQSGFAFPNEKLPTTGGWETASDLLQVAVVGDVRGRIRRDGTVELALKTERTLSYVAPDGSNDGGVGEGGEKTVRVRPGEAIRVQLPGAPRGGDGRREKSMARDLAGHSFALVLRAEPLS